MSRHQHRPLTDAEREAAAAIFWADVWRVYQEQRAAQQTLADRQQNDAEALASGQSGTTDTTPADRHQ